MCGGYNRGFMREDASLEVIFISDEEDQSFGTVPFYIDSYKSIKGALNTKLFHAHAIVGDKETGCNVNGSDADAGAGPGARYIALQEATGGVFGSICDESYAPVLGSIGELAFGLKNEFYLSSQADPGAGSMQVWVDSGGGYQECVDGWMFSEPTNSIIFDPEGPCMPAGGEKIRVTYTSVCFAE